MKTDFAPPRQERWHYFFRLCILAAILFQVCLLLEPRNLSDSYRRSERRNALANWGKNKNPATEAVFKHERKLLIQHQLNQSLLLLTAFILADGLAIYFLWNYGNKPIRKDVTRNQTP